jgi:hypothetical protein
MRQTARNGLLCGSLTTLFACSPPAPPPAAAPPPVPLTEVYERSIRSAAVRDPGFAEPLRTIAPAQANVTVATFTEWGAPPSPTQRLVWVSLPDQLRGFCHGKPDPVLAIQQALGVPPQATPSQPTHEWAVVTFTARRSALFRPCPGGTDVAAPACGNTLAPAAIPGTRHAGTLDVATTRFLLDQIWSSDRVGFRSPAGEPDWGYPFTGMGWTYNWDPQAASPVGVTEFVLRTGSTVTAPVAASPAAFCAAPAS